MKGNVRESCNFSSVNAAISFITVSLATQAGLAALMSAISFSISATVLDIISIVLFFMKKEFVRCGAQNVSLISKKAILDKLDVR